MANTKFDVNAWAGTIVRVGLVVLAALLLAGCAPFQNLDVEDVRRPGNIVRSGVVEISIREIETCVARSNYQCGLDGSAPVIKNPDNPNECTIFLYGPGWSQGNPYIIIDFQKVDESKTSYSGYSALSTWDWKIDEQIKRIAACGRCDELRK